MKVYQPAEDSELLLQTALEEIRSTDVVLEVGTGSGFVASRIAGMCRLVVATDISPHAVKEAKSKGVEVVRTDLFSGLKRVFTLILFNPPYLELEDEEKRGDWMDLASHFINPFRPEKGGKKVRGTRLPNSSSLP